MASRAPLILGPNGLQQLQATDNLLINGLANGVVKSSAGILGSGATTSDLPEGTNLYFTNSRAALAAPVQSVNGYIGAVTISASDLSGVVIAAGRTGGQVVYGGIGANDNLTLNSTSNTIQGTVFIATAGGNVTIGGASPATTLVTIQSAQGAGITGLKFVNTSQGASAVLAANVGGVLALTDISGGNGSNFSTWGIQNPSDGSVLTIRSQAWYIVGPGANTFGINTAPFASTQVSIKPYAPDYKGLVIQAAASQTVNLTEWQNSSGNVLALVGPTGSFSSPNPAGGTGINNERFGVGALILNTTGGFNTAFGNNALRVNTTGVQNAAFGSNALGACSTGGSNMGMGYYALSACTVGQNNTAVGPLAMSILTTGQQNVAFGTNSGGTNLTTGNFNTLLGGATDTVAGNTAQGIALGFAATCNSNELAIGRGINVITSQGFTNQTRSRADITDSWVLATEGSQKARRVLNIWDIAQREVIRLEATGTAAALGFFGATAVIRQTAGVATAAATYGTNEQTMLQTVYNALRTYGLLT
jgi:hypothetical protein